MARPVKECTNFLTRNNNVSQAESRIVKESTYHYAVWGSWKIFGVESLWGCVQIPNLSGIVDNSPGEKASMVDEIDVDPQLSPACRP